MAISDEELRRQAMLQGLLGPGEGEGTAPFSEGYRAQLLARMGEQEKYAGSPRPLVHPRRRSLLEK